MLCFLETLAHTSSCVCVCVCVSPVRPCVAMVASLFVLRLVCDSCDSFLCDSLNHGANGAATSCIFCFTLLLMRIYIVISSTHPTWPIHPTHIAAQTQAEQPLLITKNEGENPAHPTIEQPKIQSRSSSCRQSARRIHRPESTSVRSHRNMFRKHATDYCSVSVSVRSMRHWGSRACRRHQPRGPQTRGSWQ